MKIYLCARFSRKGEMALYADYLESKGHEVVSSWPWESNKSTDAFLEKASDRQVAKMAMRDTFEIMECDAVVSFGETPKTPTRGGRHFELGFAAAGGKKIYHIGPKEHIFHWYPGITYINSVCDITN